MNTKLFRRDVLVGAGGFLAGVLAVTLAWEDSLPQPKQPVVNLRPKAPEAAPAFAEQAKGSLLQEFQRISLRPVERNDFLLVADPRALTTRRAPRSRETFDMPRQEPWVAPYEFLIQPAQKH